MKDPHQPTALVIEDEEMVLALARAALVRAGFDVAEAADGAAAVALLDDTERAYDVIFVDLGLLGVRGEDLVLRARSVRPDVPIVVCTGEPVRSVPGATMVLAKPYKPSRIAALALELTARHRSG